MLINYINLAFSILILIVLLICICFILFSYLSSAPYLPTKSKKVDLMINAAELKPTDIVYDLGSGDGRIVIATAEKGVKKAVGFEINIFLNLFSRIWSKTLKLKNVEFVPISFWKADLKKCDKLFVYLLPSTMEKLEKKITNEMQKDSLVITNTFKFKNLNLIKEIPGEKIYVYKIN